MHNELLYKRIKFTKENLSKDSKIFVNYRDAPTAFGSGKEGCNRMMQMTVFLANLPPEHRPYGILFEEPLGTFFPWQIHNLSHMLRHCMKQHHWEEGHLLVHAHKVNIL